MIKFFRCFFLGHAWRIVDQKVEKDDYLTPILNIVRQCSRCERSKVRVIRNITSKINTGGYVSREKGKVSKVNFR